MARLTKSTSPKIHSTPKQIIVWRDSPKAHHLKYILKPRKPENRTQDHLARGGGNPRIVEIGAGRRGGESFQSENRLHRRICRSARGGNEAESFQLTIRLTWFESSARGGRAGESFRSGNRLHRRICRSARGGNEAESFQFTIRLTWFESAQGGNPRIIEIGAASNRSI